MRKTAFAEAKCRAKASGEPSWLELSRVVAFDDGQNAEEGKASAALKIARGKYFRTVDADDWVDTAALASFVHTLRTVDADCFVTRYVIHDVKGNNDKTVELNAPAWNKVLNISDIKMDYNYMRMHQLTWRLSMLHDMNCGINRIKQ